MNLTFSEEALTSIRAGWWEMILPRLFGKRIETRDDLADVVAYQWRGRFYFVDVRLSRRSSGK